MRLGLTLGYWGPGDTFAGQRDLVHHAERVGYDVCWAAEAYGSDSVSVLAALATSTTTIGLGSGVLQLPARTPAMTAMTAATLDGISGGRVRLGLGVSGPQVSEGWHGVRFDKPLARTREYVDVVRLVLSRQPVEYSGSHLQLPLPDGPGKALRLTVRPVQERIPVYLAAVGPQNLRLAGEIADGWLGIFFAPEQSTETMGRLATGRRAAGYGNGTDPLVGFDVTTSVPVAVDDDPRAAADLMRGYYALYIGGMGSRDKNFYHGLATRLGFGAEADRVQELFLAGQHRQAAAAVPFALIDATALVGPPTRIASRAAAFASAGITTLNVQPFATDVDSRRHVITTAADAVRHAGLTDERKSI